MFAFARPATMPVLVPLLVLGCVFAAPMTGRADTVTIGTQSLSANGYVLDPSGNMLVPTNYSSSPSGSSSSYSTSLQSSSFLNGTGSYQGSVSSTISSSAGGVTAIGAVTNTTSSIATFVPAPDPESYVTVTYSVSFSVSASTSWSLTTTIASLTSSTAGDGTSNETITGFLYDSSTNTYLFNGNLTNGTLPGGTLNPGNYELSFTSTSDNTSVASAVSNSASGTAAASYSLNFGGQDVSAVPEPASFALASLGALGLCGFRRRRRK